MYVFTYKILNFEISNFIQFSNSAIFRKHSKISAPPSDC